jgi:D-alanine--poly(phosphoribitol) ligase subunit 1
MPDRAPGGGPSIQNGAIARWPVHEDEDAAPAHETIWARVCARADAHPDAPAVVATERTWTYARLMNEVRALVPHLAESARPGDVVASSVESVHDAVVCVLATAAAGCCLLPLSPHEPPARRRYQLDDAQTVALLTPARPGGVDVTSLGGAGGSVPTGSAYLMYTSGSTGRPKAVIVSESALSRRLSGLAAVPGLRAGESMLALTSFTFDISMAELLLPLVVGGTVIAANAAARQDVALFGRVVRDHCPDVLQATPSFWRYAIAAGWDGGGAGRIWCGGEALTPALAADLLARCGELWNVYGPTEATIWATAGRVESSRRIRLGAALPGSTVHLIDADGAEVSGPGAEGEIVLGGAGIASGYLNRANLTRQCFDAVAGLRRPHYRTGDFGRWCADGTIEFIGRTDGQVKILGHRVELGEIQAKLEEHPQVSEAAVFLRSADDPVRAHLVAVVVTAGASPAELRAWLSARVPTVMVPRRIQVRAALPRTTAGKVDRVALAADL